jgi:glucose-1-phosphate cytidylyltransferase
MKVVILAGGFGTRLSEETSVIPKPMVEIGGKPILWHIMKIYSHFGFNDFVICLGYKGYIIKEYFHNYMLHQSDLVIDLKNNKSEIFNSEVEPWNITLVQTGLNAQTGGRLLAIKKYIENERFMLTYGDGVADVNIHNLIESHKKSGKIATITAVQPQGRFGALALDENNFVKEFKEKPKGDGDWINGGFFVCEPEVFNFLEDENTIWERTPLEQIALNGGLNAYKHNGFWKPMDTLRDKKELESLWESNSAPWKLW